MRIVVTGGEGYIGSALTPELIRRFESPVISIDNLSNAPGEYDGPAFSHPLFSMIPSDILNFSFADFLIPGDIVIHLAAIADPARSLTEPELVEEINVLGTRMIAEACADKNISMLLPSTTSVYGNDSDENQDWDRLRPQTPYAKTKLDAEKILARLKNEKRLKYSVVRFGTVFGLSPRPRFHPAVNKFCLQAARGMPLSVWQNALRQKRPYLHILDAVEVIGFLIERRSFFGETFNAATLNANVGDILSCIRLEIPNLYYSIVEDPRTNDFSYETMCGNISRMGFCFRGSLVEGIRSLIQVLREPSRA